MPSLYFAFVTRGSDGLYRMAFPDLPTVVPPAVRAGELEAVAGDAMAAHLRGRTTPLPPPTDLDALRGLYLPDDGYWLAVPVLLQPPASY